MQKVDIALNYYGKPYQTIVTLFSLLEKSGDLIDQIYLGVERIQPYEDAWEGICKIRDIFSKRGLQVVFLREYVPYLNYKNPQELTLRARLSIRYQYPLEKTHKKYLLILHNDMHFKKDIVQPMLNAMESSKLPLAGIGQIGQCWNCPAFAESLCDPEHFQEYRPHQQELLALMDRKPMARHEHNRGLVEMGHVHPLPECRLNEYVCLLNVELYREHTYPKGPVPPFGAVWDGSDTAAAWFREMYRKGLAFQNMYFSDYADHAPFIAAKSGHVADTNRALYVAIEKQAKDYMITHYHSDRYSMLTKVQIAKAIIERKTRKLYGKVMRSI